MALEAPSPPPFWGLAREARALGELPRLAWNAFDLARQPRGEGAAVLVVPGFGTGDETTLLLRAYLRGLGYRVRGWELGRNDGNVPELIPRVGDRVAEAADETGAPVRVVGWSLGGYLAREAARDRPEAVDRVVTMGTPVRGGPKYTLAARYYAQRGFDLDEIEAGVEERNAVPLRTPVTAIYSRRDSVVAWEACIDSRDATVEHVEVPTTHAGFGFSPDVYRIIADRFAPRRAGQD